MLASICIGVGSFRNAIAIVKVYDLAERLVLSQEIMISDGMLAGNVTRPPGTLPGLYLLRISTGNDEFIERIEVGY